MDFLYLESIVFTRVKTEFSKTIKNKYPNLEMSTTQQSLSNVKFPHISIKLLPSSEIGQDLSGETVNGIDANFEIRISSNKNNNETREIMAEVKRIFKTMRFRFDDMPYPEQTDGTYYSIARASRAIGSGDTL